MLLATEHRAVRSVQRWTISSLKFKDSLRVLLFEVSFLLMRDGAWGLMPAFVQVRLWFHF